VTLRMAPADCAAKVLDRAALRRNGAMALTYRNGTFEAVSARPEGFDRPWTRRREVARKVTPRDATPPQPDTNAEE